MAASKYKVCKTENNATGVQIYNEHIQFLMAPMEEAWFYEKLFSEIVISIIKEGKKPPTNQLTNQRKTQITLQTHPVFLSDFLKCN